MGTWTLRCNSYDITCFLGRPRDRSVDSSPSTLAVLAIQSAPPKGWPRFPQRLSTSSSASVCSSLTTPASVLGAALAIVQATDSGLTLFVLAATRPKRIAQRRQCRTCEVEFFSVKESGIDSAPFCLPEITRSTCPPLIKRPRKARPED